MTCVNMYEAKTHFSKLIPTHHKDPLDRMLIVQSQLEGIPIISCDGQFQAYDVDVIW